GDRRILASLLAGCELVPQRREGSEELRRRRLLRLRQGLAHHAADALKGRTVASEIGLRVAHCVQDRIDAGDAVRCRQRALARTAKLLRAARETRLDVVDQGGRAADLLGDVHRRHAALEELTYLTGLRGSVRLAPSR